MSLKRKTLGGVIWTVAQQTSVQLINFIVQIVLARVLLPADFGLIAMLAIFMNIGNILIDGGLTSSLIRTSDPDQRDYSTVFLINLIGSVFIYTGLFFSAPLIASFYNQELLTNIIRIYTLTLIIQAFVAVQVTKLTKEMKFKKQMIIHVPSVIGGGVLGIVLAYFGWGVWSLVWMNLFQTSIAAIMYWIQSGWHPNFIIDKQKLKYHFNFGYKLTLVGLMNTIYQNSYSIVIGRFFSASQLGFFYQADTLRMFPVRQLNKALDKVTYPMFASIQDDDKRLKIVYQKVMQQVFFWVMPVMSLLIVVAEPLFRVVLTEKWSQAVPYFQILCIAAVIFPLTVYNLNILKVKGRSDLLFRISAVKYCILIVGMLCIIPYGLTALVWFHAAATFISFFINTIYSGKLINYPAMEQLKDIYPIILLGAIVGIICWMIDGFIIRFDDWARILLIGGAYCFMYLTISYWFKISALREFKSIVKNFKTLKS